MKDDTKLVILFAVSVLAFFTMAQAAVGFFGCIPSCYPTHKVEGETAACERQCENADDYAGCMDDCQSDMDKSESGGINEPAEPFPLYLEACFDECADVYDDADAWALCMADCILQ